MVDIRKILEPRDQFVLPDLEAKYKSELSNVKWKKCVEKAYMHTADDKLSSYIKSPSHYKQVLLNLGLKLVSDNQPCPSFVAKIMDILNETETVYYNLKDEENLVDHVPVIDMHLKCLALAVEQNLTVYLFSSNEKTRQFGNGIYIVALTCIDKKLYQLVRQDGSRLRSTAPEVPRQDLLLQVSNSGKAATAILKVQGFRHRKSSDALPSKDLCLEGLQAALDRKLQERVQSEIKFVAKSIKRSTAKEPTPNALWPLIKTEKQAIRQTLLNMTSIRSVYKYAQAYLQDKYFEKALDPEIVKRAVKHYKIKYIPMWTKLVSETFHIVFEAQLDLYILANTPGATQINTLKEPKRISREQTIIQTFIAPLSKIIYESNDEEWRRQVYNHLSSARRDITNVLNLLSNIINVTATNYAIDESEHRFDMAEIIDTRIYKNATSTVCYRPISTVMSNMESNSRRLEPFRDFLGQRHLHYLYASALGPNKKNGNRKLYFPKEWEKWSTRTGDTREPPVVHHLSQTIGVAISEYCFRLNSMYTEEALDNFLTNLLRIFLRCHLAKSREKRHFKAAEKMKDSQRELKKSRRKNKKTEYSLKKHQKKLAEALQQHLEANSQLNPTGFDNVRPILNVIFNNHHTASENGDIKKTELSNAGVTVDCPIDELTDLMENQEVEQGSFFHSKSSDVSPARILELVYVAKSTLYRHEDNSKIQRDILERYTAKTTKELSDREVMVLEKVCNILIHVVPKMDSDGHVKATPATCIPLFHVGNTILSALDYSSFIWSYTPATLSQWIDCPISLTPRSLYEVFSSSGRSFYVKLQDGKTVNSLTKAMHYGEQMFEAFFDIKAIHDTIARSSGDYTLIIPERIITNNELACVQVRCAK